MKLTLFALALFATMQLRSQSNYSFAVSRTGQGSPLIFIPGLESGGEVWKDAVAHFSEHHACYVLTLPGFAGQPPLAGSENILETVARQLAVFVKENHLQKPVLIGHSLGGWLALDFAITYPDLAGGLVIVSSAPFLPALSMGTTISVDSATRIGLMIKNAMAGQNAAQVAASQKIYLRTMIRDSVHINEVAEMATRSHAATQGEVMYELFSRDLRPSLQQIRCPILALADWSSYKSYGVTAGSVRANLLEQYKTLSPGNGANLTIATNDSSKHFIMFDEPKWFYEQVDGWLATR
jgi:pimeloyl-ACP methyl ester carboxylesterase